MIRDPRTILLLGGTGQIGWELQRTLATLGTVVAWNSRDGDLSQPHALRARVRDVAPSLIVNAAAYTAVDKAEHEPDLAMTVNGEVPGILAEEAKRLGIPLVHYSTDYVFDGRGGGRNGGDASAEGAPIAYRENDAPGPVNAYGRTKLAGEEAIRAVGATHLILRIGWVYSLRGRNFLLTMLRLAAGRDELRVVDDQIGCPTYARMIAEATGHILAGAWSSPLATTPRLGELGGTYHLASPDTTTWAGLAAAIVSMSADRQGTVARRPTVFPISSADFPTDARRPAFSALDGTRAGEVFGVWLPPWQRQLALCMTEWEGQRP